MRLVRVVRPEAGLVTKDGLGLPDRPQRLHVSVVMMLRHVRHVRRVSELGLSDGPDCWSGLRPGDLAGAARSASGQQVGQEERL